MLTKIHIERYKSLYDVTIDLEPLTVLIGPNASGKSNICEAIYFLSRLVQHVDRKHSEVSTFGIIPHALDQILSQSQLGGSNISQKFWRGKTDTFRFQMTIEETATGNGAKQASFSKELSAPSKPIPLPLDQKLVLALDNVKIYDFNPNSVAKSAELTAPFSRSGEGIANALTDILLDSRERFSELERVFMGLIPTVGGIVLERHPEDGFNLGLRDSFSKYIVPAMDVSDGTLRILALLTALYEINTPDIICLEEPENGIHPWLLHKIVELLNRLSQDGIAGHPVQFIVTTHSVSLLNYLKPEQIRAVELDEEGKTIVHKLPWMDSGFKKPWILSTGNWASCGSRICSEVTRGESLTANWAHF